MQEKTMTTKPAANRQNLHVITGQYHTCCLRCQIQRKKTFTLGGLGCFVNQNMSEETYSHRQLHASALPRSSYLNSTDSEIPKYRWPECAWYRVLVLESQQHASQHPFHQECGGEWKKWGQRMIFPGLDQCFVFPHYFDTGGSIKTAYHLAMKAAEKENQGEIG